MALLNTPSHTPEQIREHFGYDPITGELWRIKGYGRQIVNVPIQSRSTSLAGQQYVVARVCWCHYYGAWPPDDMLVDHKNRRWGHNYITNLRLATPTENQYNKGGCGIYPKGVVWRDRPRPWAARIRINGERICLGNFKTVIGAHIAYREACEKYHGEFACPR